MNSTKLFAVIAVAFSVFASTSAFAKAKPVCNYAGGEAITTSMNHSSSCVTECADARCISCYLTTTQTGYYSCNGAGGAPVTHGTITVTSSGGIGACGGLGYCFGGSAKYKGDDYLGSHEVIDTVAVQIDDALTK